MTYNVYVQGACFVSKDFNFLDCQIFIFHWKFVYFLLKSIYRCLYTLSSWPWPRRFILSSGYIADDILCTWWYFSIILVSIKQLLPFPSTGHVDTKQKKHTVHDKSNTYELKSYCVKVCIHRIREWFHWIVAFIAIASKRPSLFRCICQSQYNASNSTAQLEPITVSMIYHHKTNVVWPWLLCCELCDSRRSAISFTYHNSHFHSYIRCERTVRRNFTLSLCFSVSLFLFLSISIFLFGVLALSIPIHSQSYQSDFRFSVHELWFLFSDSRAYVLHCMDRTPQTNQCDTILVELNVFIISILMKLKTQKQNTDYNNRHPKIKIQQQFRQLVLVQQRRAA